ncbi:hypothetical protein JHK87_052351 [Glycine soja]|nr:hypothetical protein JHK87_052351 [Glycine soja]
MTSAALASQRQEDDESLKKFMDRFGRATIQISNLNLEVVLHSMLLALGPEKFADSLCKKPPGSMDELRERAKGYIQMKEIQKRDKREANTKTDLHKSDNKHTPDKRQPLPKGPRYERDTPLTANRTTILEEAFNLEEKDPENTKRSNIRTTKQTEEERKTEVDKDNNNNDMNDNLHKNRNLPRTSEV